MIDSEVLQLAQRSYTASEVIAACEITKNQLTSYISKSNFILCSETSGQGRARCFALIDIYLISLLAEWTKITGSQFWCARSIEYLAYPHEPEKDKTYKIVEMKSFPADKLQKRRESLQRNIENSHDLFLHRDFRRNAWMIYAEAEDIRTDRYGFKVLNSKDSAEILRSTEVGYLLNATWRFWKIDRFLKSETEK